MTATITFTTLYSYPLEVAAGTLFQSQDGKIYRVTKRVSDSTVEVTPLRFQWWHRIPIWWKWLGLAFFLGQVAAQFFWHWWHP